MRPEELLNLLRRKPFVPLRVFISNGSHYDIKHPETYLVKRIGLEIGVDEKDGLPDHSVYCSWLHIWHVEDLVHSRRNGGKARSRS